MDVIGCFNFLNESILLLSVVVDGEALLVALDCYQPFPQTPMTVSQVMSYSSLCLQFPEASQDATVSCISGIFSEPSWQTTEDGALFKETTSPMVVGITLRYTKYRIFPENPLYYSFHLLIPSRVITSRLVAGFSGSVPWDQWCHEVRLFEGGDHFHDSCRVFHSRYLTTENNVIHGSNFSNGSSDEENTTNLVFCDFNSIASLQKDAAEGGADVVSEPTIWDDSDIWKEPFITAAPYRLVRTDLRIPRAWLYEDRVWITEDGIILRKTSYTADSDATDGYEYVYSAIVSVTCRLITSNRMEVYTI